ncbi:MAG: hypothetical protein QOD06_2600, partial [Candidatus Binatota bacterium]|nr:hypothetical protein [Candidatus Binatota bacterium]
MDLAGRRAVVAGAGIAGLAAALSLGERGAEVVLVDADPPPAVDTADDAFARWNRRGAPQFRHSHAFLARLRSILLEAYPEVHRALLDEGARELRLLDFPPPALRPLAPEPGDEQLATIGCRRSTFEWVLRRRVTAAPWLVVHGGRTVSALVAGPAREVRGVRIDDGRGRSRSIAADLVIDATGRTSRAPRWLAAIGAPPPLETRSPSSIVYYTRFYRLRRGAEFPVPGDDPTMADFGWIKFAVFPADHRTFSITFAIPIALPRLKVLAQAGPFTEMARAFPGLARWVREDFADPLPVGREVLAMGGLENCLRRFTDGEGNPLAPGFFAIGDSAYHTNPLYGRGATQAFLHARLLGEALDAAAGDVERAAGHLDAAAREEIEPFYRASVAADRSAARRAEAKPQGGLLDRLRDSFFAEGVVAASRVDALVFRAFVRMFNMMETPERAFSTPEILGRVNAVWLRGRRFRERFAPV